MTTLTLTFDLPSPIVRDHAGREYLRDQQDNLRPILSKGAITKGVYTGDTWRGPQFTSTREYVLGEVASPRKCAEVAALGDVVPGYMDTLSRAERASLVEALTDAWLAREEGRHVLPSRQEDGTWRAVEMGQGAGLAQETL